MISTDTVAEAALELRSIVQAIADRPMAWTLWVIVEGRYTQLRPGNSGDHCKTICRAKFFGGSATRKERFVITSPDGSPWMWADPELGYALRFKWRWF